MRYMALALDYDETLAVRGKVAPDTYAILQRVKASGRRLVLVTGRQIGDLLRAFPGVELFDRVSAENGGVLYVPRSREEMTLAPTPPQGFIERLRQSQVTPLSVGRVVVATTKPHENTVIRTIWEMGLELQIIFNGDSVMVLPSGVNKASGLAAALQQLGLSPHEVVGMGNGENDHSLLEICECGIAVHNAAPSLKPIAAYVTSGEADRGVIEVAQALIENDLAGLNLHLPKRDIAIGVAEDGTTASMPAYGLNVMVAGPSGSGKSTFAAGLIERLRKAAYQVCIVDPEGDYGTLEEIISLGSPSRPPGVNEVISGLSNPRVDIAANLLGVEPNERPDYFRLLFPNLLAMRAKTGRPHWLLLDEVHHYLPATWGLSHLTMPQALGETIMLTVHPDEVARSILEQVDLLITVGPGTNDTIGRFASVTGERAPVWRGREARRGEIVVWNRRKHDGMQWLQVITGQTERLRHLRKYAEGDLGPNSFYFRGPHSMLNLRAHNLLMFCLLGEGVDDATWLHHLRHGEYSHWFREAIKDESLAGIAERIERDTTLSAQETYHRIREAIESRYILRPLI